jgi:hypothetical protein
MELQRQRKADEKRFKEQEDIYEEEKILSQIQ